MLATVNVYGNVPDTSIADSLETVLQDDVGTNLRWGGVNQHAIGVVGSGQPRAIDRRHLHLVAGTNLQS